MSLEEQLINAVRRDNIEEVRSLLGKGADVNVKDSNYNHNTPLHDAARNSNLDMINILIAKGADVNAINNNRYTPLFWAIIGKNYNDTEIIRSFINHGAEVTPEYGSDYTVLHKIFETTGNRIDIAKLLVNHKTNLNVKTCTNYTPLHFIAMYGHTEAARLFLQYGADPNIKNKHGDTPLYAAAFHDHIEILFLLLLYGADINKKERGKINEKPELASCLAAFEQIKAMPHLGELIEANIKKEGAKAIAEYVNDEAKGQELIKEFKTIKEKYSSNEQLSFILQYLSNFINHITPANEKKNCVEYAVKNFLTLCKLPNSSEIVEKIASHLDVLDGISLALNNELTNTCQNPNTALAASQIEPSAEHKRMER
ncbi:MAG: hypothetical protein sL5_00840 [Candidatus Mesenet longicola]|uniref:Ankyrin repeat domain-containing protein n=1 Tax=Candidatus Mesenet longicola TaxID=1892558 RepID=A0A8J3HNS1_9RICK|nr:MAG: hypothetical protein sGL2_00120 [Candidatus Mesenet longicola]GHM59091.1 MAG: hypothetical protein sL5_00840 [Candidatus Mesenet longicola]